MAAAVEQEVKDMPTTRNVIPGYFTLTKKERVEVDKILRRWKRKKADGDTIFEIDL